MMPEARVAAPLSADVAARVAAAVYGLAATIRLLPGEYDDNFHLQASDSRAFVLKLMHPAREDAFVDMQCRALTHLAYDRNDYLAEEEWNLKLAWDELQEATEHFLRELPTDRRSWFV